MRIEREGGREIEIQIEREGERDTRIKTGREIGRGRDRESGE